MDRQRVRDAVLRPREALASWALSDSGGRMLRRAGGFLAGFCLAFAAQMSGMAPFGLAFSAASSGEERGGALASAAGAFGGYALAYGAGGLFYAAAVLICFACRLTLSGTRLGRSPALMPLCAGASLLCVKAVAVPGAGLRGLVMLLCECALCAGFCLLFGSAPGREATPAGGHRALWGRMAVLVAGLLVFAPLRLPGGFSPARMVAVFAVMLMAGQGGGALASGAGVALGAAMDLVAGGGPFFAAAYGFSGLVGGLPRKQGRFACAVCHVLANCVVTLWGAGSAGAMPGLLECFAASVIFVMLPEPALQWLEGLLGPAEAATPRTSGQRTYAAGRIRALGAAIGKLGETVEGLTAGGNRGGQSVSRVFDAAARKVCRTCPTASTCWDRDYQSTRGVLNDVTDRLRRCGGLEERDFPPHFASRCLHVGALCGAINEEYRAFLRRQAAVRREAESRSLMGRQYSSLMGVLSHVAGTVEGGPEYFPALEGRVRAVASGYCKPRRVSVYTLMGRMHIELLLPEGEGVSDGEAMTRSLSLALHRPLWPPREIKVRSGVILRISERERLRAAVGCTVRCRQGEAASGDTVGHLHTDDGRAVVMLSDGMGTGSAAGAVSGRAIELISDFVRSGCGIREAARAVLPVLAAQFESGGFVTLDLLEISLFTGRACLIKYGAAPSYVLRGDRAERLSGRALPAGLAAEGDGPEPLMMNLEPGDRVVMMSDGVWDNSDTEQVLRGASELSAAELGGLLVETAAAGEGDDDMSVLVVSLMAG